MKRDIQLSFTLFHRKLRKFFGRTYSTPLLIGNLDKGNFSAKNINEDMYISLKEPNPDLFLIVDVLIITKTLEDTEDTSYFSGGYFYIELFPGKRKNETLISYIKDSNPRNLMVKTRTRDPLTLGVRANDARCIMKDLDKKRDIEGKPSL